MPIDIEHSEVITSFAVISPQLTVGETLEAISRMLGDSPLDWYLVVTLEEGALSVLQPLELLELVEQHGDSVLSCSLSQFPELLVATRTVERSALGIGQARRIKRRSHKRRLVILDGGKPIGLLCDTMLGGVFSGLRSDLFESLTSLLVGSNATARRMTTRSEHAVLFFCKGCLQARSPDELEFDLRTNRLICSVCNQTIDEPRPNR